jgi:sugar (pentulose or hexulose) kinase
VARWIGLDVGTTHLKAVALDERGLLATRTEATPSEADGEGRSRDPLAVLAAAERVVRGAVAASGSEPVAGLSVASVGEEIVLLDGTGAPVGPVLCWFDARGRTEAREFRATPLHDRFPPDRSWSVFKLRWLAHHRPDELARARVVLDLASYLLHAFGARRVADWSHACRTGLFDPVATRWDPATVERAELPPEILPELVPSGTVLGPVDRRVANDLGVDPSALLVSGGHDHFVGAFGCGIRGAGDAHLSAGTSEALLLLADAPMAALPGIDQGRFVDDAHWYLHCAVPGGRVYGQWRSLLYPSEDDAAVSAALAALAGTSTCRAEVDRTSRTVSLRDVPMTADRATVMRAIVEGAGISSAAVFQALAAAAPAGVTRVVAAGHATADPLWRSLRLGLLGRPIEFVAEREATAVGAALLARRAVTGDAPALAMPERHDPTAADFELAARLRQLYGGRDLAGATR